jgi:hypothetical protein
MSYYLFYKDETLLFNIHKHIRNGSFFVHASSKKNTIILFIYRFYVLGHLSIRNKGIQLLYRSILHINTKSKSKRNIRKIIM